VKRIAETQGWPDPTWLSEQLASALTVISRPAPMMQKSPPISGASWTYRPTYEWTSWLSEILSVVRAYLWGYL
jgi:hypothetical protein